MNYYKGVLVAVLLLVIPTTTASAKQDCEEDRPTVCWKRVAGGVAGFVVGGFVLVGGAAVVLPAAGFTTAGIAAGSLAANAMSVSATTGFGAGVIATLQSVGVAGLSKSVIAAAGAAGAYVAEQFVECDPK